MRGKIDTAALAEQARSFGGSATVVRHDSFDYLDAMLGCGSNTKKSKKPVKGSAESKARMKKVRAARAKKEAEVEAVSTEGNGE